MGKVSFDISMSLDGYITAANRRPKEPLGDGGEQLHEWAFNSDDEYNRKLLDGSIAGLGAAKAGVIHFSRSLAYLAEESKIRVNAQRNLP